MSILGATKISQRLYGPDPAASFIPYRVKWRPPFLAEENNQDSHSTAWKGKQHIMVFSKKLAEKTNVTPWQLAAEAYFFRSSMASLPQHELAANTELSSFSDLQLGMTSAKKPSLQQIRAGLAKRPLLRRVCQWNTFQKLRPIIIRIFKARRTTMSMCMYIYIIYMIYIYIYTVYISILSMYFDIFDDIWSSLDKSTSTSLKLLSSADQEGKHQQVWPPRCGRANLLGTKESPQITPNTTGIYRVVPQFVS